ncbi:MAG TPA: sensor histidine kinase, partial [Nitrospiraceae bacterium]|nr:sensor histidine kinase [Nitrospiraceae bacterium]
YDVRNDVPVDHARLAQLFSNLIGNAIAHGSRERPIRVRASADADRFELSVANAGARIKPELFKRLFAPFQRGDESNGLGLGLFIANQIAEAHGGKLAAESDEYETRFTFSMPIAEQSKTFMGSTSGSS